MMALIEKEPDDQYIRVLKLVFLQALMEDQTAAPKK